MKVKLKWEKENKCYINRLPGKLKSILVYKISDNNWDIDIDNKYEILLDSLWRNHSYNTAENAISAIDAAINLWLNEFFMEITYE